MCEETRYERLTPKALESRKAAAPIAYLPLGTLEWHGPHLPLGSDHLQSQGFFIQLARRVGGVVLPPLFLGPDSFKVFNGAEYYGMDIHQKESATPIRLEGSAYWVPDRLFSEIVDTVLKQIRRAGFRILVAHGHGPSTNYIIENTAVLEKKHDLRIFTVWRSKEERNPSTEFQYDHAAANETSIMMALHPSLVHMDHLPSDPKEEPLGLIGKDPRIHASPDHGKNIVAIHLDRMETILRQQLSELASTGQ
ncbi:MAG: creatininase family protein [Candidatus Bathyarchaeota archaeon]|nr:creatininase family protein [Candidatus Bathyarchaeota archaeon]